MPLKTAKLQIEDEVKEYRKDLLRDLTKRSDLKGLGYDSDEIDCIIQEEKDDIEKEVNEYRAELMAILPEREAELEIMRRYTFAIVAFREVWLPKCLTPSEEENSRLVTKKVYEHYINWCESVGIDNPYSLPKVRSSLKEHYHIKDIRAGLRHYGLAEVPTRFNREQLISRYEKAVEESRNVTCPYCERRRYDSNLFEMCYWCNRIMKDGLQEAMDEYLSQEVPWQRTGDSMHLAYRRMLDAGKIEQVACHTAVPEPSPIEEVANKTQRRNGLWHTLMNKIGI